MGKHGFTHVLRHDLGGGEANRHAHRRRRLPRAQRSHPRGRPASVSRAGTRRRACARAGGDSWRTFRSPRAAGDLGDPAPSRQILGTTRTNPYKLDGRASGAGDIRASRARRARRDRRRGHARSRGRLFAEHGSRSSACRRRSTTTSAEPINVRIDTRACIAPRDDRLHTTAESTTADGREVMGRTAGWIERRGIAGGADVILIPEQPSRSRRLRRDPPPTRARQGLLDRGRLRGIRARRRRRGTKATPTSSGTCSCRSAGSGSARAPDRAALRLRDSRDSARPRPARRLPDPARPCIRDALRPEGGRPRAPGTLRPHGRAPGRQVVDVSLKEPRPS